MPDKIFKKAWNIVQLKLNRTPSFLYNVVQKERPDLIHGHFALDSYRLIGLKRTFNLPLIVNFYGYDVLRLPKEFGWKRRYKKLAKVGDLFVVGSEDMKANVMDLGFPKKKIKVLKLGMNMNEIKFEPRTSAEPKIMMVGRMVEKKGFEYAIQAVKILKEQKIEIHLDLYGDGVLFVPLKNLTKELNVEKQVTFHGQTKNTIIFKELYQHDILLVPSVQAKDGDREGIPQTTVEGMATGIPVIASDHAGLSELVIQNKTGLQIPERDTNALCKALKLYLSNKDLVSNVSRNGRLKVEEEHNIYTQIDKLENMYHSII